VNSSTVESSSSSCVSVRRCSSEPPVTQNEWSNSGPALSLNRVVRKLGSQERPDNGDVLGSCHGTSLPLQETTPSASVNNPGGRQKKKAPCQVATGLGGQEEKRGCVGALPLKRLAHNLLTIG